jgi:hypothetical protein
MAHEITYFAIFCRRCVMESEGGLIFEIGHV